MEEPIKCSFCTAQFWIYPEKIKEYEKWGDWFCSSCTESPLFLPLVEAKRELEKYKKHHDDNQEALRRANQRIALLYKKTKCS